MEIDVDVVSKMVRSSIDTSSSLMSMARVLNTPQGMHDSGQARFVEEHAGPGQQSEQPTRASFSLAAQNRWPKATFLLVGHLRWHLHQALIIHALFRSCMLAGDPVSSHCSRQGSCQEQKAQTSTRRGDLPDDTSAITPPSPPALTPPPPPPPPHPPFTWAHTYAHAHVILLQRWMAHY